VKLEDLDHEQTIKLMRQTKYLKGIFDEQKWKKIEVTGAVLTKLTNLSSIKETLHIE